MSDVDSREHGDRPRPQYGEYATPEEQQARIRQPDATDALSSGQRPDPPKRTTRPSVEDSAEGDAERPRGPLLDRVATIALLAYGLVNLFVTVPEMFTFEQTASRTMAMMGVEGSFTNFAAGRLWGGIAAIVFILGWIVTAYFSLRRLRRGKITFWVPLVGGLVTVLVATVCITIPLAGDPAVLEHIRGMSGAG